MEKVELSLSYGDLTALECILNEYIKLVKLEVTQLQNTKVTADQTMDEESRKAAIRAQTARLRHAKKCVVNIENVINNIEVNHD